jgi:hypothetical protein
MERKRISGTNWVWICPKCKSRQETPATPEEAEKFRARYRSWKEGKRREERGEAPDGADAELWAIQQVMEHGRDFEKDVGPRQEFYRRIYDDSPPRFAKMMQEREAFLKKEAASVQAEKDEGLDKSLELAESLLGEVANSS